MVNSEGFLATQYLNIMLQKHSKFGIVLPTLNGELVRKCG
jgi:hypothetical protein